MFIDPAVFRGQPVISQPEGESLTRWLFSVEASPWEGAEFSWRGPRGQLLKSGGKYEQIITADHQIKLVIRDVTIADMGPYPFQITIGNQSRTEQLGLRVEEEPQLVLSSDKGNLQPYYRQHQVQTIAEFFPPKNLKYNQPCLRLNNV